MTEQELRLQIVEMGKKLVQENLVQGTWGNISVRLDDDYMLVTPSGLDYALISPDDMVKVNIRTMEYEGDRKPSAERKIHAGLLFVRPDVNAIIHTHSLYCSVYAAANKPIPVSEEYEATLGKSINVSKYALPSTKLLTKSTIKTMGNNKACLMANHGVLCCGKDLASAFTVCKGVEQYAKDLLFNGKM